MKNNTSPNKQLTVICLLSVCAGIIFYSIQKNWIIFQFPTYSLTHPLSSNSAKKNITLHWFARDAWHKDTISILWENDQRNCMLILNTWLDNAMQEEILPHDVHIETVALTSAHEAIISFDSTLFTGQASIQEKIKLIQGMLKTIKEAIPSIQTVHFLLHQELYLDQHLDFSVSWPCT